MNKPPTHPDSETLQAFLDGKLPVREQEQVESHVATCDQCCDVLKSIPPGSLDDKLRRVETWTDLGEIAETLPLDDTQGASGSESGFPAELLDHPRYRVIKQLGAGGMGVVYQVQHRLMNRMVALKVINPRFLRNASALKRFQLEVTCASQLNHRNIVTAHDAEQAGQLHFLVMEFIDGISLADLVRKRGALSTLHACNYAMQVAQGLQHAFECSMVHRDIKPQNLMRARNGVIKILDFGLARLEDKSDDVEGLTSHESRLGTPDYIAPEQARDPRRADIRADIYSLGCTLYYLLSGQVPFEGGTATEKIVAHCEHAPTPLDIVCGDLPVAVLAIVKRMMAKDPDDRFQTPADVVKALRPFGKPQSSEAPEPAPPLAEQNLGLTELDLPPEPLGVDNLQPAGWLLPGQAAGRSKSSHWSRWLRRNRRFIIFAAGAVSLLVLAIVLLPAVVAWYRGGDTGQWIDLIARCDARHTAGSMQGSWTKKDGELSASGSDGSRMALPYRPPKEYDFELVFTRRSGEDSIAAIFVADKQQGTFEVDAWRTHLAGFQNIDGQSIQSNSTRVTDIQLRNDRKYTLLVKVRRGRIDGYLDGKLLATLRGEPIKLSILQGWSLGDTNAIGVGVYNGAVTFHRIRVRPVR